MFLHQLSLKIILAIELNNYDQNLWYSGKVNEIVSFS